MPRTTPGAMVNAVMQIRPASPEDAARLTEIALAAKRHWGYPERGLVGGEDLTRSRAIWEECGARNIR